MAESTNLDVIKRHYKNMNEKNIAGVLNDMDDNIVFVEAGKPDIPFAGIKKGKEEVKKYFEGVFKYFDVLSVEPNRYYTHDDMVIVTGYSEGIAKETGKKLRMDFAAEWRVNRDKKIDYYHSYLDTLAIMKALKPNGTS